MFYAVYSQYGMKDKHACETLQDAIATLEGGSDAGEIYPIGIYDSDTRTIYPRVSLLRAEFCIADIREVCRVDGNVGIADYPGDCPRVYLPHHSR